MSKSINALTRPLRDDGYETLSPSETRVLIACIATVEATNLLKIRKIMRWLGDGSTNHIHEVLQKLAHLGLVRAVESGSSLKKHIYVLNCYAILEKF